MKDSRFRRLLASAAASLIFAALRASASDPVPAAYADLYQQLATDLGGFEATLDAQMPSQKRPVTFATELLAANGNRGEVLLSPGTMDSVRQSLDAFQAMGIKGVTVAIHYPLFDPAFPRHDDYVAFFESVCEEVHHRGMAMDVENHVVFTGTPFSPIQWNWSGYTVASLAAARAAMAQIILDQVKPDYLNIGTESDTEATLTGIASLSDPAVYAGFVSSIGAGLRKGSTKLGAGMGAWDDLEQAQLLTDDSWLDFLVLHLYDLHPASLANAVSIGGVASAHGKRLILDECWLYKERDGEPGGVAMAPEIFKRDSYSFFAPLDQQFLRCAAKLAQVDGMEYVSAYWSTFLLTYLTYTPELDASPYSVVAAQADQAESQALQAGTRSSTGDYYAQLAALYPAPQGPSFHYATYSIPTRDGKSLAADLYYVESSPQAKPVILIQTPYNKNLYRLPASLGQEGFPWDADYNVVVVDWRGFYGSSGAAVAGYDRGLDGYDCVEWIASQPFSNGRVGTWGSSALGLIQFQTARYHPPHLVCAEPRVKDFKTLYEEYYYGGDYRKEHVESLQSLGFLDVDAILAHPDEDATWQYLEATTDLSAQIAVPMLVVGGWYDHFPTDVLRAFEDLRTKSATAVRPLHKLIYGPWLHEAVGEAQQGVLTYDNALDLPARELKFFDYYLRQLADGWDQEPVASYYQMGEDNWFAADSWTGIARQGRTLYLRSGGYLLEDAPTSTSAYDSFQYDPADPTPALGGSRFNPFDPTVLTGPQDLRTVVESRSDVLVYTTPPYQEPLRINGSLSLSLYISSDRTDTDFCVRLTDVYPDGRSLIMTQGIRRARFRNSLSTETLMTPGQIYPVTVRIEDLALTIMPGHSLRLDVCSADYPHFDANRNDGGPMYVSGPSYVATNHIYRDAAHPSHLDFQVIPETRPGEVSGGGVATPLRIEKSADSPTGFFAYFQKSSGVAHFNVYEGGIGSWYDHSGAPCDAAFEYVGNGEARAAFTPGDGDHYYLVTSFNENAEGPSGYNSAGQEISPAQSVCPP